MHNPSTFDAPRPAAARSSWLRYASPALFYPLAGRMIPFFAAGAALLAAAGLYTGLVVAPIAVEMPPITASPISVYVYPFLCAINPATVIAVKMATWSGPFVASSPNR